MASAQSWQFPLKAPIRDGTFDRPMEPWKHAYFTVFYAFTRFWQFWEYMTWFGPLYSVDEGCEEPVIPCHILSIIFDSKWESPKPPCWREWEVNNGLFSRRNCQTCPSGHFLLNSAVQRPDLGDLTILVKWSKYMTATFIGGPPRTCHARAHVTCNTGLSVRAVLYMRACALLDPWRSALGSESQNTLLMHVREINSLN